MSSKIPFLQSGKRTATARKGAILIRNLPKSITRNDLVRSLTASQVKHIAEVQLEYRRFNQTDRAVLTVSDSRQTPDVLAALKRASISEHFLHYETIHRSPLMHPRQIRTRGAKGREEAAMRQSLPGDGPGAGIPDRGKAVVIWGFPTRIQSSGVYRLLQSIKGLPAITTPAMVPPRDGLRPPLSARALVRMRSTDDAHRLVRMLHKTPLPQWSDELRAKVVY